MEFTTHTRKPRNTCVLPPFNLAPGIWFPKVYSATTFSACGPFCPWVTSIVTF